MISTAAAIGLGLLSSMPAIPDTAPTYKDFVIGLRADEAPEDVSDIFGSWRFDSGVDSIPSLDYEQYMDLASPADSVLATPVSNSLVTALSVTLVMDASSDILNGLELDQSIEDDTDFFRCDDTPCPLRIFLDISDIADVAPPIVSGSVHVESYAAVSGRRNPVGFLLEDSYSEDIPIDFLHRHPAQCPMCLAQAQIDAAEDEHRNAVTERSVFEDSYSEDDISGHWHRPDQWVIWGHHEGLRLDRPSIPDRKVTPVRRNVLKRFTSKLRTLVSLVRQNVTSRNEL